jgi:allophanate hydrolase
MNISTLQQLYKDKTLTPRAYMKQIKERIETHADNPIWIYVLKDSELEPYLKRLESFDTDTLPLYGVPFAIKDNIDLEGVATTAACEEFSYIAEKSA